MDLCQEPMGDIDKLIGFLIVERINFVSEQFFYGIRKGMALF
jgi:hypothetical protein